MEARSVRDSLPRCDPSAACTTKLHLIRPQPARPGFIRPFTRACRLASQRKALSSASRLSSVPHPQGPAFLSRLTREWLAGGDKASLDAAVEASVSAGQELVAEAAARLAVGLGRKARGRTRIEVCIARVVAVLGVARERKEQQRRRRLPAVQPPAKRLAHALQQTCNRRATALRPRPVTWLWLAGSWARRMTRWRAPAWRRSCCRPRRNSAWERCGSGLDTCRVVSCHVTCSVVCRCFLQEACACGRVHRRGLHVRMNGWEGCGRRRGYRAPDDGGVAQQSSCGACGAWRVCKGRRDGKPSPLPNRLPNRDTLAARLSLVFTSSRP
jgi:hypothetical protein